MDSNHVIPQKTGNEWVQINQGVPDEIVHETVQQQTVEQTVNDQLNELMNEKAPPSVQQARGEVPKTPLRDPNEDFNQKVLELQIPTTNGTATANDNSSPGAAQTPLPPDKPTDEANSTNATSNLPENVSIETPEKKEKVKRGPRGPYKKKAKL